MLAMATASCFSSPSAGRGERSEYGIGGHSSVVGSFLGFDLDVIKYNCGSYFIHYNIIIVKRKKKQTAEKYSNANSERGEKEVTRCSAHCGRLPSQNLTLQLCAGPSSSTQSQQCSVVMLDEHGLDIGSEEMAGLIIDAGNSGASRLAFCVGGPYGHGQKLQARADKSIKLSSLVLNHQIALVVLMEQLYRSWTILKGQKYHH